MIHFHVDMVDKLIVSPAFDTVVDAENYALACGSCDYYVLSCRWSCA